MGHWSSWTLTHRCQVVSCLRDRRRLFASHRTIFFFLHTGHVSPFGSLFLAASEEAVISMLNGTGF